MVFSRLWMTKIVTTAWIMILPVLGSSSSLYTTSEISRPLTFGMISGGSDFFRPLREGWEHACDELGVTCLFRNTTDVETETCDCECPRTVYMKELIEMQVDAIAMKPCGDELMLPLLEEASAAGIPVITFDSDLANSTRLAYVGTDQAFMGETMARLLRQLRPEGGTFGFTSFKEERIEGFVPEITRYNDRDDKGHWHEVELDDDQQAEFQILRDNKDYGGFMHFYANLNVTAIVAMAQSPMRNPNWTDIVDTYLDKNITYIGTDGDDWQLDLLNRRYVDGLVGQMPYHIGLKAAHLLHQIITQHDENGGDFKVKKEFHPTNLISYSVIPIDLPSLEVDQHLLGNMNLTGIICFSLVAAASLLCMGWTYYNRSCPVVSVAQPFFLIMIAVGVLIMSSTLIPLSFDDGGDSSSMSPAFSVGICMSIPWLAFTGFTITFSALFSKTWRVNRLFRNQKSYARVRVTEKDVLAPFFVIFTCNVIVLVCWTVIDPMTYVRQEYEGTDYWNRVIASYGKCQSEQAYAYLVPLLAINLVALAIACWQAMETRGITSDFSETKYIALALSSILQTFLTGVPIVAVVRDIPEAFYLVSTFMIFVLCLVILLFIFLPKINKQRQFIRLSPRDQGRVIRSIIHNRNSKKSASVSGPQSGFLRYLGVDSQRKSSEWSRDNEGRSELVQDSGSGNIKQKEYCSEPQQLSGTDNNSSNPGFESPKDTHSNHLENEKAIHFKEKEGSGGSEEIVFTSKN